MENISFNTSRQKVQHFKLQREKVNDILWIPRSSGCWKTRSAQLLDLSLIGSLHISLLFCKSIILPLLEFGRLRKQRSPSVVRIVDHSVLEELNHSVLLLELLQQFLSLADPGTRKVFFSQLLYTLGREG